MGGGPRPPVGALPPEGPAPRHPGTDFRKRQKSFFPELRHSEERFRLLIESVVDYAIFMLDPGGHITTWNAGAQRMKGYRADEIVGQHFRVFYPEEDQERRHPEHELELAVRDGRYEEEGWRIRKDGTTFWANVVITALFDHNRRLVGFGKVTRDVTERRLTEDAREAGATELAAAVDQLRSANEQTSDFLAIVAHELHNTLRQNPLNPPPFRPANATRCGSRNAPADPVLGAVGRVATPGTNGRPAAEAASVSRSRERAERQLPRI